MKNIFILIAIFVSLLVVYKFSNNFYYCKVQEIKGLDEYEQKEFGMKNGKVDGDIYKINLKKDTLEFVNTSNNASFTMYQDETDNSYQIYYNQGYTFMLNEDTGHFIFSVVKANYSADYIGFCKK